MNEEERVAEEYRSTLSELNSNSKVEINALTMLAEDCKEYAVQIAVCIENQLKAVPNRRKLPVLYLIDSICKNYPKSLYVQLFTQNIVSNFCNVFEVSDEKVRKQLHKLRLTWNATKIFPQKKLNAIDERVHDMDPNWPILHLLPKTKPLQQDQKQQQTSVQQSEQQQSHSQPNLDNKLDCGEPKRGTNQNQHNGRRKRARLNQTRNNQPCIANAVSPNFVDPAIIQAPPPPPPPPHELAQVLPTTFMDPSITLATSDQLQQLPTTTFMDNNLMIAPNDVAPQILPQILCPFNQATQPKPLREIQPPHTSVLNSLYGGNQCSNCSLRFEDNEKYANHLDWHFRQNLKSDSMFARRKWYYPLNLWVQFREINDDDRLDNNNITDNIVNQLTLSTSDHEVPTAPASKDDEKNICSVCHETFEKFWAEEEEEWRLKNARLYEDERVYHPLCLKDYITAS